MTWDIQYDSGGWTTFPGGKLIELEDELNYFTTAQWSIPNNSTNQALLPEDITEELPIRVRWSSTVVWEGTWTGGEMTDFDQVDSTAMYLAWVTGSKPFDLVAAFNFADQMTHRIQAP